jgi:hypothetical protein
MRGETRLLVGTPGTLVEKSTDKTGTKYVYRVYYEKPGLRREEYVCKSTDAEALEAVQQKIKFAQGISGCVGDLKKLGFQVLGKTEARFLVDLFNAGLLGQDENVLLPVGELGKVIVQNEIGIRVRKSKLSKLEFAVPDNLNLEKLNVVVAKHPDIKTLFYVHQAIVDDQLSLEMKVDSDVGKYFHDTLTACCMAGWHAVPCRIPQPAYFGFIEDQDFE